MKNMSIVLTWNTNTQSWRPDSLTYQQISEMPEELMPSLCCGCDVVNNYFYYPAYFPVGLLIVAGYQVKIVMEDE